jgi:hypothetical protein
VAFDLTETRVSARDAARYVEPNDVTAYARAVVDLVDDGPARTAMGRRGRELVEQHLAWQHQQVGYLAIYDGLVGRAGPERPRIVPIRTSTSAPETPEASTARETAGHLAATEA